MVRRELLFLLPFSSVLVLAFAFTTLGPTLAWALPRLAWWEASLLSSSLFIGIAGAAFFAGRAGDRLGYRRSLLLGLGLLPVGLLPPLAGSSFPLLFGGFLLVGVSFSVIQTAANPLVAHLFPDRPGLFLTLLHVAWSGGAFAGPTLAGLYLAAGDPRGLFGLVLAVTLLFLAGAAAASRRLPEPERPREQAPLRLSAPLVLLVLLAFFYLGSEMSLNSWLPAYLQATGGLGAVEAGGALGLFWGMMGLGRVALGPFLDRLGVRRVALAVALLGVASLALNGLLPGGPPALRWGLTGFFYSVLFPAIMAVAARLFPGSTGSAVGAIFSLGILGGVAVPALIGALRPVLGPGAVLLCAAASLAGMAGVLLHPRLAEAGKSSANARAQ